MPSLCRSWCSSRACRRTAARLCHEPCRRHASLRSKTSRSVDDGSGGSPVSRFKRTTGSYLKVCGIVSPEDWRTQIDARKIVPTGLQQSSGDAAELAKLLGCPSPVSGIAPERVHLLPSGSPVSTSVATCASPGTHRSYRAGYSGGADEQSLEGHSDRCNGETQLKEWRRRNGKE